MTHFLIVSRITQTVAVELHEKKIRRWVLVQLKIPLNSESDMDHHLDTKRIQIIQYTYYMLWQGSVLLGCSFLFQVTFVKVFKY